VRRSLFAVVAVVLIAAAAYAVARSRRDFWDFEVYRTAGIRALAAEPLYRADDGHYQFKYWPAFAFAMIPFGFINPEAGKVVWYALSVGLVALFLRQSISALPDRRSTVRVLTWWTLLLTGKFIVIELVNGQTNALLGVLIVMALIAVQQKRLGAAGVIIAVAAFVKPYALLLLPWLAVAAGAHAMAGATATLVAGWLLPAVWYGWQTNLDLLAAWSHTVVGTTPENLMLAENISFATMWAKWIGVGPVASAMAAVTTVAALAAAGVLWWLRRRVAEPAYLEVSFLLVLVPLISPQGWDYVLLLGTPAIVCLVDRFRSSPVPWRLVTVTGFVLTSFTIFDLMGRTLYFTLVDASGVTIGALLLLSSLAGLRARAAA
jgi:Glycosyltransferase family 87